MVLRQRLKNLSHINQSKIKDTNLIWVLEGKIYTMPDCTKLDIKSGTFLNCFFVFCETSCLSFLEELFTSFKIIAEHFQNPPENLQNPNPSLAESAAAREPEGALEGGGLEQLASPGGWASDLGRAGRQAEG